MTYRKPVIHPFVALLLARMEEHPDEFITDTHWANLYQHTKGHWNSTEKKRVAKKLREIRLGAAHEKLMKAILAPTPAPSPSLAGMGTYQSTTLRDPNNYIRQILDQNPNNYTGLSKLGGGHQTLADDIETLLGDLK